MAVLLLPESWGLGLAEPGWARGASVTHLCWLGGAVISALGCTKAASGTWWQAAARTRSSLLQAGVGTN